MWGFRKNSGNSKKGFSLIELLVAISIVAVISAVGYVSYSNAQANARDVRRKQDLRAIAVALELYYANNKAFPNVTSGSSYLSTAAVPWISALTTPNSYINVLPLDPMNTGNPIQNDATNFGYAYTTNTSLGISGGSCSEVNQWYMLVTKLENTYDPEANRSKSYKRCDGSDLSTTIMGLYAIASQ